MNLVNYQYLIFFIFIFIILRFKFEFFFKGERQLQVIITKKRLQSKKIFWVIINDADKVKRH
jgi:hypothetical protein